MPKYACSLFFLLLSFVLSSNGQVVTIKKGSMFETVTSFQTNVKMETLGNNMEFGSEMILTAEVDTKDVSDSGYVFLNIIKRMQTKSNVMGQNIDLDSDRPSDMESEAGKMLQQQIDNPIEYYVNKSGSIRAIVNSVLTASPLITEAITSLLGEGQRYPLLLVLPRTVKKGDTWIDSTGVKDSIKVITTYTVTDITANDYVMSIVSNYRYNVPIKQQGIEIELQMIGSQKSDDVYDKASCVLKRSSSVSDFTGTMEVMGQTIPMTTTTKQQWDVKKL